MEYKPEYAKGQIVVWFKDLLSEKFILEFGKTVGCELESEVYRHDGEAYIFKVAVGLEEKAIKEFKKYSNFVVEAGLRDLKMESRWSNLGELINILQKLGDNVRLPNKRYNK